MQTSIQQHEKLRFIKTSPEALSNHTKKIPLPNTQFKTQHVDVSVVATQRVHGWSENWAQRFIRKQIKKNVKKDHPKVSPVQV